MNQFNISDQEWLKILGKGMVTLPKKWREDLGLEEGDIVKAKKEGNRVIIETQQQNLAPYRVYSDQEIDEFLDNDILDDSFLQKIKSDLQS